MRTGGAAGMGKSMVIGDICDRIVGGRDPGEANAG
jgi:hypothetical protein